MTGLDAVERLREQFLADLTSAADAAGVRLLRDRYLGRKSGALTALLKDVAGAAPEVRPLLGKQTNELKRDIEQALTARLEAVSSIRRPVPGIDVTLDGREPSFGHRHPLTQIRERIEAIFVRMGYEVLEGNDAEDDYHNFEALNMPPEHPARDMQDTLYLATPIPIAGGGNATLIRTHTSAMQIRYMETHEPPVRVIAPGRVYRRDNPDLTHTPMFQQVEALVVGERVTMADLKGTVIAFLREVFDADTEVLFRPSFFPYTEPSAEIFISCVFCQAKGCPICKRSGWLEVAGSGMVHPAVFEAVGYDPERYTGFAFGLGIERVALLKYRVDDIRLFYENDLRFLEQFPH